MLLAHLMGGFPRSRRSMRSWEVIVILLTVALPAWAGADATTQPAPPRCGIIIDASLKDSAAASLVETSLLHDAGIVPVERAAIDKIITEQEMQALFSPEGSAKRKLLGGMVKADVLGLLRKGVRSPPRPDFRVLTPGEVDPGSDTNWIE